MNAGLQNRNVEPGTLNSDLANVLANVNVPLAIVDANLRLRRMTPQAERFLNVTPGDLHRRITDFRPTFDDANLQELLLSVMDTLTPREQDVQDREGRWYSLRIRPCRTVENKVDGAVIVIVDLDVLKTRFMAAEEGRDFAEAVVQAARGPFLVLDPEFRVRVANRAFYLLSIENLSERQPAEQALRESEERRAKELSATRQLQSASALRIEGGDARAL